MKSIKRKLVAVILILVCFLLQTTVVPYVTIGDIGPNLLIVLVASFGFMRGKKGGLVMGFLCGLLYDIQFSEIIGFYALIYMLLGYANGYFKKFFFEEDIKLPLVLIASSEFLFGITIYVLSFMLKSDFHFLHYLGHVIMPELVYTILVTLILYPVILKINKKLEDEEKRSASKFV